MKQKQQGLLLEIKGDMCRLGYLKLLTSFVDDFQSYSKETLAELLENSVTTNDKKPLEWSWPDGLSKTGLVPSARAINYVELAYKLGFFMQNNNTLDSYGKILRRITQNFQDRKSELLDKNYNPLILENFEKIFFLVTLIENDGLAILPLMEYHESVGTVSRQDAMNHFMEAIYPVAIGNYILSPIDDDKKYKLKEFIDRANSLWTKSRRESLMKIGKWNMDEQYALYRHTGNPRIEWLVDVGFLRKTKPNFTPSTRAKEINNAIKHALNEKESDLYSSLGMVLINNKEAKLSEKEIMNLIRDWYTKFHKAGYILVDIEILAKSILLDSLKNNLVLKLSTIINIIENMKKDFPKHVRTHYDIKGKPTFIKMDPESITL